MMELKYEKLNLAEDHFYHRVSQLDGNKSLDSSSLSRCTSTEEHFTIDDLQRCLFSNSETQPVRSKQSVVTQRNECFWCDASLIDTNFQCPSHKHENTTNQTPLALRSLPPEVELCASNIPGTGFGVCAKQAFPVGAWIGPYEGTFVKPEELSSVKDTSYMWEIFKEGKLAGYIDGSNENVSSWMRFIRCARHRGEQNLFAFQYLGKVFYRSFKAILPGQEMLVWYDEKYPQYFGIPSAIFDMGAVIPSGASSNEVIVVSPRKASQPSFFPSPPPSPVSNPSSPFAVTSAPITEKCTPPYQLCEEKLSFYKERGLIEPVPYTTSTPSQCTSPLDQNNGDPLRDPQQSKRETSQLLRGDLDENATHTMNSVSYSTSEQRPSSTLCQSPLNSSLLQTSTLQKFTIAQAPQKPYQCGHCPASFTNVNQLRTHSVIHVSNKPFKCGYCSRFFNGPTTLNNHIRSHVGGRQFASSLR